MNNASTTPPPEYSEVFTHDWTAYHPQVIICTCGERLAPRFNYCPVCGRPRKKQPGPSETKDIAAYGVGVG